MSRLEERNKMSASNLAIVITPNVVRRIFVLLIFSGEYFSFADLGV